MRPLLRAVPLLLLCAGCEMPLDTASEFAAARRAVERWVQRHPMEWTLQLESSRPLTRPQWSQPCASNPHSGFVTLRHQAAGTEIDLSFRCPIGAGAGSQELEKAFSHAVLQRLPHGIESRGWRFDVLTPSSSVHSGVTFSMVQPGRLLVTIHTPLYAVQGHSKRASCQPAADAPSAPECHLSREHRIPLRLRLLVPSDLSRLN